MCDEGKDRFGVGALRIFLTEKEAARQISLRNTALHTCECATDLRYISNVQSSMCSFHMQTCTCGTCVTLHIGRSCHWHVRICYNYYN